ncbi:MAG: HPF/RaiA family ribosome-associated protein, partial [Planctomycetota bacterium]
AEIVCMVSGGKTLVATETGSTIHESLEFASDNMARQIKRYKGKLRDRRGARAAKEHADEAPEASDRSPRIVEEE